MNVLVTQAISYYKSWLYGEALESFDLISSEERESSSRRLGRYEGALAAAELIMGGLEEEQVRDRAERELIEGLKAEIAELREEASKPDPLEVLDRRLTTREMRESDRLSDLRMELEDRETVLDRVLFRHEKGVDGPLPHICLPYQIKLTVPSYPGRRGGMTEDEWPSVAVLSSALTEEAAWSRLETIRAGAWGLGPAARERVAAGEITVEKMDNPEATHDPEVTYECGPNEFRDEV